MATGQEGRGNIALLIDADNASAAHFDSVMTVLAELGTVNIRRAYGNWSKATLKTWAALSVAHAIEPQQQFDLTKGKNATDMKMTIDAMDLMASGRVDGFGLMSSDSDFTPLATRIRQQGIPVYGFGSANTPEGFRRACTRFLNVAALKPAEIPVAAKAPVRKATPASVAPAKAAPAKAAAAPVTPPPAPAPAPAKAVDAEVVRLLIDAYDEAKRDERGFVALGPVGQRVGNRSSFDVRNYGFKRLSDLVGAIPNFITEVREGGQTWIKRVK
ncbi:NYN domain-containing protein [Sphingobium limneticum]|uniref:NYN domain-containing protein n=1 Tax=Sphingobium limneticum TaxID=1007511 RepID=A0A5J5I2J3_9SPHN|nr:NYN domain-containing protein [Sphingobium limneticum]KAA9016415.1 NYN domain-containing protein [Sphingobium limneticum]KAA9028986.1 NYN domain-containing protein [Sphingobium limneticum]